MIDWDKNAFAEKTYWIKRDMVDLNIEPKFHWISDSANWYGTIRLDEVRMKGTIYCSKYSFSENQSFSFQKSLFVKQVLSAECWELNAKQIDEV